MKKFISICLLLLCVFVFTQNVIAGEEDSKGAATNSGDGVSDGSGLSSQDGPKGNGSGSPAPNSGDGVPDGSGK